jgi:hypothetical protein
MCRRLAVVSLDEDHPPKGTAVENHSEETDMKSSMRFGRLLAMVGVTAAAATGVMAQAAHAGPEGPAVPTTIDVEPGHKVFLIGHATGVQIYSCNATPSGPRWGFIGPRAVLYGNNGQLIATHFGGPTWQGTDGSTVVASRVEGVVMDSTAIPWLLLKKESTTTGPDGDRFTGTSFIQRTGTAGGLQPGAEECNPETVGDTVEVPYTADYYFWKSTGG